MKMALTLLLAICAVLQTSPANRSKQQEPPDKKHESPTKSQPSPPVTVVDSQASPSQQRHPAEQQTQQSPDKPIWGDVPTWGLVIVGLVAAWIAIKTLKDIKKQTRNAKIAARAAKNSADAALKTAEAVINAERAWIMVSLQWQTGTAMRLPTGAAAVGGRQVVTTSALVECVIMNAGKTPAWIVDKRIALAILDPKDLPTEPDLSRVSVVDPILEPIAPNGEPIRWEATPGCEGKFGAGKLTIVYGAVLYRDIFNKPRSTRFGYIVNSSYDLERIPGNVTYNQYS